MQILIFCIFLVLFSKKNNVLVEEDNPSEKKSYSQGRTRWYWYRWYCGNPKVFPDGGELTRNIIEKKKTGV